MEKNVAVIGCGFWGKNLVRNLHDMGVLRMVCDSSAERLMTMHEQYSDIQVGRTIDEALSDASVKAVVIATPAGTHYELAKRALSMGKDVFVEKPLALEASEGEELVRIAENGGRILMVGHILHYHPAIKTLKSLMTKGVLGRIQYVYSNRLNFGKIRREENILWSFAPHDISMIIGLLNEEPVEVSARGANYLHPEIADVTMSQMRFASGINAHIFVSWLHPFKEQKLIVVGDKQMAVFDDTASWESKLMIYPHEVVWSGGLPEAKKAEGMPIPLEIDEPLKAECRHFIDCVTSRKKPVTDGCEGMRGLRVLNALQRSLDKNGIAISLAGKSTVTSPESKDYFAHETAVVDSAASVGDGTKIWHFSHVMKNATVGKKCNIGQNVVISPGCTIGNNVKIQNNISVYTGVHVEDDAFLGPSMVFTNVYNPRGFIERKNEYRDTFIRRGATIGANATIVCGNTIGEYSFVGAGAVVTKDVPPYALVYGNPGKVNGWVCRCGWKLPVKVSFNGESVCAECGSKYKIIDCKVDMLQKGNYASTSVRS